MKRVRVCCLKDCLKGQIYWVDNVNRRGSEVGWLPFPSSLQFSSVSLPLPSFPPFFLSPLPSCLSPCAAHSLFSWPFLSSFPLCGSTHCLFHLTPTNPQTQQQPRRDRGYFLSPLCVPSPLGSVLAVLLERGFVSDNLYGFKLNLSLHQLSWSAVIFHTDAKNPSAVIWKWPFFCGGCSVSDTAVWASVCFSG